MTRRTLALAALLAASSSCGGKKGGGEAVRAPDDATAAGASDAVATAPPPAIDGATPTATGGDPLADARAAVTAWLAARTGGDALDAYVDQYVGEAGGVKVMFVGFPPGGADGAPSMVKLTAGPTGITEEKVVALASNNRKDIPLGYGSTSVTSLFPKGWVPTASVAGGDCDDQDACEPTLELFPDGGTVRVPLGVFKNNATGEGDTGSYEASLSVIPIAGAGKTAGAMLVVVDNRESGKPAVLARRGVLVGKGPTYEVLWTGDRLGDGCRLSVYLPAGGAPGLAYGCGDAPAPVVTTP